MLYCKVMGGLLPAWGGPLMAYAALASENAPMAGVLGDTGDSMYDHHGYCPPLG